jgi:hypothetical protein
LHAPEQLETITLGRGAAQTMGSPMFGCGRSQCFLVWITSHLLNTTGYPMGSGDRTNDLQTHLHELAEGLQAASYFVEILQSGGQQPLDAKLLDKTAAQLRRAQESFRHLRARLGET